MCEVKVSDYLTMTQRFLAVLNGFTRTSPTLEDRSLEAKALE